MEKKLIELDIDRLAFEGGGMAKSDNMSYFVRNAIPGDKILANIIRKKKKYAIAEIEKVLIPSQSRVEPECKFFGECGGCTLQNMEYSEQIKWKRQFVIDNLTHIAKLGQIEVQSVLSSPRTYHYRNKMEFSFSDSRWLTKSEIQINEHISDKNFALGLHSPENFMKVLNIDNCPIAPIETPQILEIVRSSALAQHIVPFNSKKHTGFLKNLVIRYSLFENKIFIILVSYSQFGDNEKNYINEISDKLFKQIKTLKSFIWAINSNFSNVAVGEIEECFGDPFLIEDILEIKYRISPFSFFQTNPFQLNRFISTILEIAEPNESDIIYDFYCGTGSITLPISRKCKFVYGFESSAQSIEDAKYNAELNNISNAQFSVLDLSLKNIADELQSFPKPDIIILDPPRSGLHKNTIENLIKIFPKKIIYVSCNPSTLARDLEILKKYYSIEYVQPIDMFPQTYHIETIVKLNIK
ncbi:MAG TPA: 23S rRNA (uracil(1939)-C(5))-methyltransferase RlmD [Candidatus Kapabacteria bacterium]|nr:23S rRNA (uracil(1939)-C(5))-methyltransferase RlmD [Candidatus Kapabacteria bacterium]